MFGLNRETVLKMCRFSLPPGYTRTLPVVKPKLGALLPVIDAILEADHRWKGRGGNRGKREFIQVLRLMEAMSKEIVTLAVTEAIRLGAIGFDAVKLIALARLERRPPVSIWRPIRICPGWR